MFTVKPGQALVPAMSCEMTCSLPGFGYARMISTAMGCQMRELTAPKVRAKLRIIQIR